MKKSRFLVLCITIAMFAAVAMPAIAADSESKVLIKNVNIFYGTSEELITGKDVVLIGNKIGKIIPTGSGGDGYTQVIDGKVYKNAL